MKRSLIMTFVLILSISLSSIVLHAELQKAETETPIYEGLDYDALIGMKDTLGLNEEQIKKITELKMQDKESFDEMISKKRQLKKDMELEKKNESPDADMVQKLEKELYIISEMIQRKKISRMADLQEILTRDQMSKYEEICTKRESIPTLKGEDKTLKTETE